MALQHALLVEQHERGRRKAHHHVGLRVGLLGQELGGDDRRSKSRTQLIVMSGIGCLEGLLVGLELIGFESRIDRQLAGTCHTISKAQQNGTRQQSPHAHWHSPL